MSSDRMKIMFGLLLEEADRSLALETSLLEGTNDTLSEEFKTKKNIPAERPIEANTIKFSVFEKYLTVSFSSSVA
jgi:hypothetical protein